MAKRRVSRKQARLIHKRQQQRLQTLQTDSTQSAATEQGLLIAQYGSHLTILADDGKQYTCHLRQHLGSLVPGDRVVWERVDANSGVVVAALPRRNELTRQTRYKEKKPVAANLDQVVVVLAVAPAPQWQLLDSYLVAIELLGLQALIVVNKIDLSDNKATIEQRLNNYKQLGYPVLKTTTYQSDTLLVLEQELANKISLFAGQSGVGKSSLLQYLLNDPTIVIGEISSLSGLGTHTTSTARLYPLPTGGCVIDSPGVREFNIAHYTPQQIAQGFVEFRPYLQVCRFRDCTHHQEPGCAVVAAVQAGEISQERWENYVNLS